MWLNTWTPIKQDWAFIKCEHVIYCLTGSSGLCIYLIFHLCKLVGGADEHTPSQVKGTADTNGRHSLSKSLFVEDVSVWGEADKPSVRHRCVYFQTVCSARGLRAYAEDGKSWETGKAHGAFRDNVDVPSRFNNKLCIIQTNMCGRVVDRHKERPWMRSMN